MHVGFSRSQLVTIPRTLVAETRRVDIVIRRFATTQFHAAEYIVTHGGAGPQSVVLHCAGDGLRRQVLGLIWRAGASIACFIRCVPVCSH